MSRLHKTLITGLIITIVVYGGLQLLGRKIENTTTDTHAPQSKQNTRFGPSNRTNEDSQRDRRSRRQKLSPKQLREFLKNTIIESISYEKITLSDAINLLNNQIIESTPDDHPYAKVYLDRKSDIRIPYELLELGITGLDYNITNPLIEELKVRNIPLNILLKYICDATRMTYFSYRGDVYLRPYNGLHSSNRFYSTERLNRVKLENIDASELAKKFEEAVDQHDYFGPKSGIEVMMSKQAKEALRKGTASLPTINLDLKNITLQEACMFISHEYSDTFHLTPFNTLIFDPLKQMPEEMVNHPDPFADPFADPTAVNGGTFTVPLDENWSQPLKEEDSPE